MTALEILEETIEFYQNNPRSIDSTSGACKYKSDNGNECAFQRCVETDLSEYEGLNAVMGKTDIQFKKGYEGYPKEFWNEIQWLHDHDDFWQDNKLSENGLKQYQKLRGLDN
jgi:hypothetical protein